MNVMACKRCGADLGASWPEANVDGDYLLACLKRSQIDFIRELRAMTGVDLVAAKFVLHHYCRDAGSCHRCGARLADQQ